ncbi:UNVERIFIED_CONTAM: hypothetical protein Slati_1498500 [Sesamum latifolium]|uniref:Uncharacterized protein n=1 Tax=Sesamum latifolium TaxID=2727402 RepID=A0AAW2X716_9LAMI
MEGMLFAIAHSGNLQALHDTVLGYAGALLKLHSRGPVKYTLALGFHDWIDGYSPLHFACADGHLQIIKFLLEFGRQKSGVEELCMKTDLDGRTALHSAVVSGKIVIIDVFFVHYSQAANLVTLLQEIVLHLALKHHQRRDSSS